MVLREYTIISPHSYYSFCYQVIIITIIPTKINHIRVELAHPIDPI